MLPIIASICTLLLSTQAQIQDELIISAAASLKGALEAIELTYQQKKPEISIIYNFGASGSLQQQIEQGAPVDIFVSAASQQMDALESKDLLIEGTRRNLLSNKIVLITPVNITDISGFEDLTKPEIETIALGEPRSVPAGKYATEVFNFYGILGDIQNKFIYGNNVSQVLTYVDTENVDAGMVFLTDAKTSKKVKIVATAPSESHTPIIYPIALIKGSQQVKIAKEFIEFLASNEGQMIFDKYGFQRL
ncbi:molybdate ABC transporter substrate-binding protein [Gloeocapsa sp. PCC 73106]|uniref:molybdate ABC transporter substrate-binding protein n=1 Tax=Gloeocapsa sp. PCC 73106 TaxID=102232 RepID=UPI0002AD114B|nr:molybdate ABC transporter substrate-binding protein [Gloeocapsa sp. PCC 73106]ELR96936.1 molybdenum ABC transporter, periplasmic molybdate-binding protein [Gloeocapsa sp. PCC 73106]